MPVPWVRWVKADEPLQQALWQGLLDPYGDVRAACSQSLVRLVRRFPEVLASVESKLIQSLTEPAFKQLDAPIPDDPGLERRPAYDYAYDALWVLVAGQKAEQE